jgi:hypothetical protein
MMAGSAISSSHVMKKESDKMRTVEGCRKECVLMLTEDYKPNNIYFADESGLSSGLQVCRHECERTFFALAERIPQRK